MALAVIVSSSIETPSWAADATSGADSVTWTVLGIAAFQLAVGIVMAWVLRSLFAGRDQAERRHEALAHRLEETREGYVRSADLERRLAEQARQLDDLTSKVSGAFRKAYEAAGKASDKTELVVLQGEVSFVKERFSGLDARVDALSQQMGDMSKELHGMRGDISTLVELMGAKR